MAWTTPRTWVALEGLTAALMNTHVRDNENALYNAFKVTVRVYTANATWTKPAGLIGIRVRVVGPGGGGGGCNVAATAGGGGGGGGYAEKFVLESVLGATETVTVPVGAAGGAATGGTGGAGATASFGTHVTATGGEGGLGSTSGDGSALGTSATTGVTDTSINMPAGGPGGLGASGDVNIQGQAGAPGLGTEMESNGIFARVSFGGVGGSSVLGGGGRGALRDAAGSVGGNYGGGGGGAAEDDTTGQAGGAGAGGLVIVEEYTAA